MKHYLLKAYMHGLENIICVFNWRTQENYTSMGFLNQAHTSRRPAHTWFLEIDPYGKIKWAQFLLVSQQKLKCMATFKV